MREALKILATFFLLPGLAATLALILVFELVVKPSHQPGGDEQEWIHDATRIIRSRYFEDVTDEQLAYDAIRGMARRDRYSDFIDPANYEAFREQNEGQYVGVGFIVYSEGDPVTILYPFPRSPAARAGLETGDRIIAVDGEDFTGKSHEEIIGTLKAEEGTPVRVTVLPYHSPGSGQSETFDRELVREMVEKPSVFDAHIIDPETGAGYVRLAAFQERTADDLAEALLGLTKQGLKSLILDLRRNRGGLLDEAIDVASLFIDDGVVVRTEGRAQDSNETYRTVSDTADFRGLPLVIVVDDGTASASEVVAGALQDHARALLVGDRTYGKGVVQSVIPRRYEIDGKERIALLKLTTSRYLTPAGRAIEQIVGLADAQRGGLEPDVWLPLEEGEWRQLEKYFRDREIPPETWELIDERCPLYPRVEDSGFRDRQVEMALDILNGDKPIQAMY